MHILAGAIIILFLLGPLMSAAILRRIATCLALLIMAVGVFSPPAVGVAKEDLMTNCALWAGGIWLVVHAVAYCIDGRLLND